MLLPSPEEDRSEEEVLESPDERFPEPSEPVGVVAVSICKLPVTWGSCSKLSDDTSSEGRMLLSPDVPKAEMLRGLATAVVLSSETFV